MVGKSLILSVWGIMVFSLVPVLVLKLFPAILLTTTQTKQYSGKKMAQRMGAHRITIGVLIPSSDLGIQVSHTQLLQYGMIGILGRILMLFSAAVMGLLTKQQPMP